MVDVDVWRVSPETACAAANAGLAAFWFLSGREVHRSACAASVPRYSKVSSKQSYAGAAIAGIRAASNAATLE